MKYCKTCMLFNRPKIKFGNTGKLDDIIKEKFYKFVRLSNYEFTRIYINGIVVNCLNKIVRI